MAWPAQQPVSADFAVAPDILADHSLIQPRPRAANFQIGMPGV